MSRIKQRNVSEKIFFFGIVGIIILILIGLIFL